MNHKKLLIFIFYLISVVACKDKNETESSNLEPIIINLQPFNGTEKEKVTFVYSELRKIYPNIEINEPIELPYKAYYKQRNRYKADSLIKFLRTITPKGHVTIGLTNKDLSTTKGDIKDYGIMGLGYQPGSSCVVSTFRLAKENILEQYFKVSIHELGHTQGLPHCPVKTCFMRDADGKNYLNEEIDFCPNCKLHLIKRGWTFNKG